LDVVAQERIGSSQHQHVDLSWHGAAAHHAHLPVPHIVSGGEGVATLDIDGDVTRRVMGEASGLTANQGISLLC